MFHNFMRSTFTATLAVGLSVGLAGETQAVLINPGDTATVLVSGKDGSDLGFNQATHNGQTWNEFVSKDNGTGLLGTLQTADNQSSGIEFSIMNGGGFASGNRGSNIEVTHSPGIVFPAAVTHSYSADNFGSPSPPRDGLMVYRFASDVQLIYDLTLLASVQHNAPAPGTHLVHYNVGGTYGGTSDRNFTGGDTLTLDGSKHNIINGDTFRYDTGVLLGLVSTWDADINKYVLDLQVGHAVSSNGAVTALNGIWADVQVFQDLTAPDTVVPEPASVALIGMAGAMLMIRRRRMQA